MLEILFCFISQNPVEVFWNFTNLLMVIFCLHQHMFSNIIDIYGLKYVTRAFKIHYLSSTVFNSSLTSLFGFLNCVHRLLDTHYGEFVFLNHSITGTTDTVKDFFCQNQRLSVANICITKRQYLFNEQIIFSSKNNQYYNKFVSCIRY